MITLEKSKNTSLASAEIHDDKYVLSRLGGLPSTTIADMLSMRSLPFPVKTTMLQ